MTRVVEVVAGAVDDGVDEASPWSRAATMVLEQLVRRGIRDPRVLEAMSDGAAPRLRRRRRWRAQAYDDRPLPIGFGQTISQPYMVARATELAAPRPAIARWRSAPAAATRRPCWPSSAAQVFAVEIVPELAARAAQGAAETRLRERHASNRSTAAAAGPSTRPTT